MSSSTIRASGYTMKRYRIRFNKKKYIFRTIIHNHDDYVTHWKNKKFTTQMLFNQKLNGDNICIELFDDIIKMSLKIESYQHIINPYEKAKRSYINFYRIDGNMNLSDITYNDIANSSAGISGWAKANINL